MRKLKVFCFGFGQVAESFINKLIIEKKDFDLIMKLDADIILPNNYILEVSKRMNSNLQIGLCGGICLTKGLEEKITNLDHVRGAIKCYRKKLYR